MHLFMTELIRQREREKKMVAPLKTHQSPRKLPVKLPTPTPIPPTRLQASSGLRDQRVRVTVKDDCTLYSKQQQQKQQQHDDDK